MPTDRTLLYQERGAIYGEQWETINCEYVRKILLWPIQGCQVLVTEKCQTIRKKEKFGILLKKANYLINSKIIRDNRFKKGHIFILFLFLFLFLGHIIIFKMANLATLDQSSLNLLIGGLCRIVYCQCIVYTDRVGVRSVIISVDFSIMHRTLIDSVHLPGAF